MICNFLIFDNLGSRYDPYMGYSGLHRRILLCQFFKKWKNLPKVHVLWPILFQILYWSFFCSPFWSIRSHLRIKCPKNADFQDLISRDRDIFGKNGYVRWIRLKKFFKMSKSCFFQKKWPNGLNLRVSRSPNSWCLVRIEFFSKFRQKSMELGLFCAEKNNK